MKTRTHSTYSKSIDDTMNAFRRALPVNGEAVSVREDVVDKVAGRMLRAVEAAERAEGLGPRAEGFDGDPFDGMSPADVFDASTGLQGRSPCASDASRTGEVGR